MNSPLFNPTRFSTTLPNSDFPGRAFSTYLAPNPTECNRACLTNPDCNVWTYNTTNSLCQLKNIVPNRQNSVFMTGGIASEYIGTPNLANRFGNTVSTTTSTTPTNDIKEGFSQLQYSQFKEGDPSSNTTNFIGRAAYNPDTGNIRIRATIPTTLIQQSQVPETSEMYDVAEPVYQIQAPEQKPIRYIIRRTIPRNSIENTIETQKTEPVYTDTPQNSFVYLPYIMNDENDNGDIFEDQPVSVQTPTIHIPIEVTVQRTQPASRRKIFVRR